MLKTLKYIPLIIILLAAIWLITIFIGSSKAYSDNSTFVSTASLISGARKYG
jgi:hypothetical protein